MKSRNFSTIISVSFCLVAAVWFMSYFITVHPYYQTLGVAGTVLVMGPFLVRGNLPYDLKVIGFLCFGYAVAGKGFAYVSPVEPVFVGEIVFVLSLIFFAVRYLRRGGSLIKTKLHLWILLINVMAGASLLFRDFSDHQLLAIRDSATMYYGFFFFYVFILCEEEKNRKFIGRVLIICAFGAVISHTFMRFFDGRVVLAAVNMLLASFYVPHPDTLIPLICGAAGIAVIEFKNRKSILWALAIPPLLFLVISTKTASIFSFVCTAGVLVVFARRFEFIAVGLMGAILGALALIALADSELGDEIMGNHVDAFTEAGTSDAGSSSSTDWRLAWWGTVYDQTMKEDPLFGLGLGADLTTQFFYDTYGANHEQVVSGGTARYPHNIVFTILGRMGFFGLAIFMVFMFVEFLVIVAYCRLILRQGNGTFSGNLALFIASAGFFNSFVQATYEAPYAAVIHWVCLAYVAAEVYRYRLEMRRPLRPQEPRKNFEAASAARQFGSSAPR